MPGHVRCRAQVNRVAVSAAVQNIDTMQAERKHCWLLVSQGSWHRRGAVWSCDAGRKPLEMKHPSFFPCKLEFDTFRGEAETTRNVEICVPLILHFPFSLPSSSANLKVLVKTICLQKGFLDFCLRRVITRAPQRLHKTLKQILFQCRR